MLAAVCLLLAGGPIAVGQDAHPASYAMKPPDVVVPADVPLGQYRRIIQPFQNWTLICDENLKAKRKVCNITQSFVDRAGAIVFSWSMAADENGKPFMILRVPASIGPSGKISLNFAGKAQPVNVAVKDCDATVCVAYVPVGPILREQIGKNATARISYPSPPGSPSVVDAPLGGLAKALSAIN
ncbi:invasion associated locus B family protein [Ciceribacter sp. RN22]|nr:invasion associated locus B family protein [Ciceribacter sp. RN22]MCO6181011.1 invasion associated locus B family protein [Ciceribacter sp. RN22]